MPVVDGVAKQLDGRTILSYVDLRVRPGEQAERVVPDIAAPRPAAAARYVTRRAPFTPCRRSGDTAEWGL